MPNMVNWRLYAWTDSSEKLHRHWFDPELAVEWGRRFLSATTIYAQIYCYKRWFEAANLGAYMVRAIGTDATTAPLPQISVNTPAGRALGWPSAALMLALNPAGAGRTSFRQVRQWTDPLYRFGGVEDTSTITNDRGQRVSAASQYSYALALTDVQSNQDNYNNSLIENIMADFLRAGGVTLQEDWVSRAKAASDGAGWQCWPLPVLPGAALCAKWHPSGLDGWWEIAYADQDEKRLRGTAGTRRDIDLYPGSSVNADAPFTRKGQASPLTVPLISVRTQEVQRFVDNPFEFFLEYENAIISRNLRWLSNVPGITRAQAESASRNPAVARALSDVSARTMFEEAQRDRAREVADVLDPAAAALMLFPGYGWLFAAFIQGAKFVAERFDVPDEETRRRAFANAVMPLAITGNFGGDGGVETAKAPDHSIIWPLGWSREASRSVAPPAPPLKSVQVSPNPNAAPDPSAIRSDELVIGATEILASAEDIAPYKGFWTNLFALDTASGNRDTSESGAGIGPVIAVAALGGLGWWLLKSRR